MAASAEIINGRVFSLDYALDAFDPPPSTSRTLPEHTIVVNGQSLDDRLDAFHLQASSQIDGLRHRRVHRWGFYSGVADEDVRAGSAAIGVQRWADDPIVSRAVLVDIEGARAAAARPIEHDGGPVLEASEIDDALRRQGVPVRPGDVLLVHTGWARWYLSLSRADRIRARGTGRWTGFRQDRALLAWLWDERIAAVGSDTVAIEVLPPVAETPFAATSPHDRGMMHQELIGRLGIPIGELWALDALAADSRRTGRWTSFVSIKPLALTGGVGSPPNAMAIR